MAAGELLELRQESGGIRHYLLGSPIHAGDLLVLLLDDGSGALWHRRRIRLAHHPLHTVVTKRHRLQPRVSPRQRQTTQAILICGRPRLRVLR